ncbi:glycosyltransferase family 2 protein [Panacibacter sp. DH6]|uniref:Glycosyltransferase family 2 protein n=1 Tax=Panacibacter microcysteis TaxID=2793269 RepID=A0A931E974_9BACT|nr:glycosyltransferase family 2 protein [Panacibacter microcysteis]MBG9377468.1 glycosyltransferase family 2 protein [Panacibacter microcysteis]
MQLSVIIVNFRSAADICNCLESAMQYRSCQSFEWIVVDNDSADDSKEVITSQYPFVRWINMGYNAGFSRANNAGIKASTSDIVLLLNPDTLIMDDAIAQCYMRFKDSKYSAASAQLYNIDHSPQITGNFFMTGGLNHLLPLPYLGPFLKAIALSLRVKKTNVQAASNEEKVHWINGAFMMVKKSVLNKAGLFDEDFFLYFEEIEWCSRLLATGEICVYGDLKVVHIQGSSINKAVSNKEKGYTNLWNKKGLQLLVSGHLRTRKQFGIAWFLFHLITHSLEIPIFFLGVLFENIVKLKNPFLNLGNVKNYSLNVLKVWTLVWRISLNRPYFYKML